MSLSVRDIVTEAQVARAQFGLQVARDIYATQGIGIRRVEWGYISPELAGGLTDITSVVGSWSLTMQFTGRPGALDLFLVQTMGLKVGRSPQPGTCDKDSLIWMSGVVLEFATSSSRFFGVGVAHEAGHYLGLGHTDSSTNVMYAPGPNDPGTGPQMVGLTADQAAVMRDHCMMLQT